MSSDTFLFLNSLLLFSSPLNKHMAQKYAQSTCYGLLYVHLHHYIYKKSYENVFRVIKANTSMGACKIGHSVLSKERGKAQHKRNIGWVMQGQTAPPYAPCWSLRTPIWGANSKVCLITSCLNCSISTPILMSEDVSINKHS